MADAVVAKYISKGPRKAIVALNCISDGTGETGVIKVALSSLLLATGVAPTKLAIQEVQWSIQGFTTVRFLWDHNTDNVAVIMAAGNGYRYYGDVGVLPDPGSAGGTGDIILTSVGAVSGATYDIVLSCIMS